MARRVRDSRLESRAAREKLKPRGKPYYKVIDRGLHLGYRKGKTARQWVVRRYVGRQLGKDPYSVETIAAADDVADANGLTILNFWQAQERARELHQQRAAGGHGAAAGPYTIQSAINDYLTYLEGRSSYDDTRLRLAAYVSPAFAEKEITELSSKELTAWHRHLAKAPPRVRSRKGKQKHRAIDLTDPEQARRRKLSANKVLGQLKAALNHAFANDNVASDKAWRRVKPFKGVTAARVRWLTVEEAQRIINATDPEFRPLVRAALETGCRYGELCRLLVSDFDKRSGTLLIRQSKSGKPRHVVLTDEGQIFFAQLTVGRPSDAPMFGRIWNKSEQRRPMLATCERARISPPVGFHILRHTWASLAVMNGVPLMVVAQNLGHADTRMVEKHYGHLAPSYVADAIRAGAPRFGILERSNVKAL
jgi:integrase